MSDSDDDGRKKKKKKRKGSDSSESEPECVELQGSSYTWLTKNGGMHKKNVCVCDVMFEPSKRIYTIINRNRHLCTADDLLSSCDETTVAVLREHFFREFLSTPVDNSGKKKVPDYGVLALNWMQSANKKKRLRDLPRSEGLPGEDELKLKPKRIRASVTGRFKDAPKKLQELVIKRERIDHKKWNRLCLDGINIASKKCPPL
jgi:hypothetical protein